MPAARNSRVCPPALLLGAVCSFVGCCLVGRGVAARNSYVRFQRFHFFLSPQSLFYPTASQVRALGRDLLDRDRIAVIVGGSSVLHGIGQRAEQAWTRHLQDELGDGYRVLNLAMPGARTTEFGATAAEMLTRDFPRLIFISDIYLNCAAAGTSSARARTAAIPYEGIYRSLFWEAYFKDLLPVDAARDAAVRAWLAEEAEDPAHAELFRGVRLDSLVYSRDLWTTIAYTHFATIWPCALPLPFTRARRDYPDLDCCSLTAAQRREPGYVKTVMEELRGQVALGNQLRHGAAASAAVLDRNPMFFLPPVLRERTLLLAMRLAPDFVARLSPEEQADHDAAFAVLVGAVEKLGLAALAVEADYSAEDFVDRVHLSEAGGRKLAREAAPAVRRLARRLGYTTGERRLTSSVRRRGRDDRATLP